jgi:SAM-dependent methyltransferase
MHGFANLLPPGSDWEGFDTAEGFIPHEAVGTIGRINRYFGPVLRGLGAQSILSIGCGDAADVTELCAMGFDAFGFDIPYRASTWRDNNRDDAHVFVADGRAIPVADATFDVAIALGVLEHVGAVGTTADLEPDWHAQRVAFIRESTRVLKPGGSLIVATPNGSFPIDVQHNISRSRPFRALGSRTGVSIHPPGVDFLPNYRRVRRLAAAASPALTVSAMPLAGYLGLSFEHSPALRSMAGPIRAYLKMLDRAPRVLRESVLNPYLIVAIQVPDSA